jgi:hypothetical protein
MEDKNLYIIAGCNGAGKTTASYTILPDIIECKEFVNADEIAKGLSPFQPEKVSIEAGRIMLGRINELLEANKSFAFETTLSTKSYKDKILKAKKQGYTHVLLLDQDSIPSDKMVQKLLSAVHALKDKGEPVAAVGPRYKDRRISLDIPFVRIGMFKSARVHCKYPSCNQEYILVDFLISSGTSEINTSIFVG